jgi:hypothetical protein
MRNATDVDSKVTKPVWSQCISVVIAYNPLVAFYTSYPNITRDIKIPFNNSYPHEIWLIYNYYLSLFWEPLFSFISTMTKTKSLSTVYRNFIRE